jgi:hypothetical protein
LPSAEVEPIDAEIVGYQLTTGAADRSGDRGGELEECQEVLGVAFVADGEAPVASQPGDGAFDLPAVAAESVAGVDAA